MSNSEKTLITIATYNEIENLPKLTEAIWEVVPEVDILVIDDNSPDGTGDWIDEKMKEEPRLKVIHREGKLGLGTATIAGMKYGIEHDYKYTLNMDADFSHHPKYLPAVMAGTEDREEDGKTIPGVDVMIGSRYVPGGGVVNWPLLRRFMSKGINFYARFFLWLPSKDNSGAYRKYRVSKLKELDFDKIVSKGYSFQEEILWLLKRVGCTFGETPIIFEDRVYGQSKINQKESVIALWIIFRLGIKNWIGL